MEFDRANIRELRIEGKITKIITTDGRAYPAISYEYIGDKVVAEVSGGYKYISIPLPEVKMILVEEFSFVKTFLATTLSPIIIFITAFLADPPPI